MMRSVFTAMALACLSATPGLAQAEATQSTPAFLDLAWADLLPEGEAERINQAHAVASAAAGL